MSGIRQRDRRGQVTSEKSQSVNTKRRRLVKGLAGVTPGIFTLYSGNAAAMASAAERCIINDRARFDGSAVLASDDFFTDEWQRGTLSELAIEVKSGSERKWLAGVPDTSGTLHWYEAEISATGGVTWNQSAQEWLRCADSGGKRTFQEPQLACPTTGQGTGPWKEQNVDGIEAHSLFCVDDDGNVVSAYPEECGIYRPVNRSCWASIDPGAPDPTERSSWW